jgi:hypothetical protein
MTTKAQATTGRNNAFISYSWVDRTFARRVATTLAEAGIPVWLDTFEFRPGDNLEERIRTAIGEASYFLSVVTKASIESLWVTAEVAEAFERKKRDSDFRVIALWRSGDELPVLFRPYVFIDFRRGVARPLRQLTDFLVEARGVASAAAMRSPDEWAREYLRREPSRQMDAVKALLAIGAPGHVQTILGDLESRAPSTQRLVMRRVRDYLSPALMPQLNRISRSRDVKLIAWACGCALSMGDQSSVVRLLQLVRFDDQDSKRFGLRALSECRDYTNENLKVVVDALVSSFEDPRRTVRLASLSLAAHLAQQLGRRPRFLPAVIREVNSALGWEDPELQAIAGTVYGYLHQYRRAGNS